MKNLISQRLLRRDAVFSLIYKSMMCSQGLPQDGSIIPQVGLHCLKKKPFLLSSFFSLVSLYFMIWSDCICLFYT